MQAGSFWAAAVGHDGRRLSFQPPVPDPGEARTPRLAPVPPHPWARALAHGPTPASPSDTPHLVRSAPLHTQ